jgi:hypothetical protein
MSFSDLLGNAAQKLQGNGFANEIGLPTMLFDLSSVSSNDKSWVGDAFNFAGNAFRTTLQATTYPIRKPIGAAVDKVLLPAAMISYETGGRFLRQPLSAALTTLGTGDVKKSWENREEISPGQALSYLQSKWSFGILGPDELAAGDFNIFDPNDRKTFDEDWGAKSLSGAYDTFFTTVTDPLGKLGKAAGLARKAVVTRPLGAEDTNANRLLKDFLMPKSLRSVKVISPQTLARTINEGREEGGELYNTLSWFAKSDRVAIRNHPMVQQSNDADTLAYMLGEAKTVDDVADTLVATARLGTSKEIGSAAARLIAKRRDLAFVLDKINDTTDLDKKVLNNVPTNGITDDVDKLDTATELVKQVEADPYYRMIRSFNDKPADLSKRTFGKPVFEKLAISRAESKAARVKGIDKPTKFPTVGVIQPTKYHPLIAVVNFGIKKIGDTFQEKPAGYVNFNDSDSFSEMTAFGEQLRRLVGGDIAQPIIDEHTRAYLRAGGLPELRSTVAVSFEDLAISAVNRSLGLTDEQGLFIWNQYKSRRQTALDTIRDRKFLMTNDDVILKIPYLERQGANALPMVDLENYVRVLQANKGVLKSIGRKGEIIDPDSMRYVSGILNDMWKASVLLRLGYTIRNVSEATLSILGKGYGLLALGDLNRDGFKSWYNNRVQGIERLADRTLVNKGLREDSIQIRRSLAETQSEIFATEKVINEARLYAQAAERLFLQGKLNEAQYKELLELSEYLSGQYLYHGSTTPIRALDKNRPLAMSFSQDTAEQYADAGMPRISASEIYKRLSGRAYPQPKNLINRETGELIRQPARKPSPSMQTIGADMREGFINTVNNGNVVEVLNPQTGRWTTIDPNTVSQKLLTTAEFRIRKPGNQGAVISQKVYGTEVDLRTENLRSPRLNLVDYPELKNVLGIERGTPRNRAAWEGKEKALLDWMRANGVGKVILPDNKANGRATVLVDPEMVEGFGESPFVTLTQRRLDSVKRQQQILGNEPRMLSIIERTIKNQGGTFDFAGDVPVEGISVAVRGATHTFKLEDASANPQGWIDSVAAHFEKNLEKFGKADHFGTWVEDIDGVPHIWAEPTNVIMDRAQAVKLGVERNQKSVADLAAIARGDWDNAFIVTRGTGDEGATARFALGQGTEASRGNVAARAEGLRPTLSGKSTRERIAELSESLSSKREYPTAGLAQVVREAADMQAVSKKNLENLLVKLDARVVEETRIGAPKQIQGTGRRIVTLYDGTKVEIDDAFRGELGQILYDRTDNTDSYRRFVDHPSQFFAAEHNNFVEDVLTPNMPDYYSGWANQLNTFFRSPDGRIDPLVEQMLNGARPEEIVKWLRKPENVGYARRFNIDVPGIKVPSERLNASIEAEDFVGDLYSAFNRYLPDAQMQETFRAGQITEIWLRNHFKNATELPDIVGRIVPTSPQARNIMDATAKVIDRAFYFLGSLPETTLARHPLARAIYRSGYQDRLDVALSTKRLNTGNAKAELTVDEINNLRRDVVESTRKEVNKTLFTIIRKSYAGEKMRFIMPFFNAWENTIRRWSGLATENPAVVARAGQIVSSLRNQPNVIDAEGNPTNEFSYDNKIVVPMSEGAISAIEKIPVWGRGMADAIRATGTQVSIPVRSLDVLFQGEYLAGFGPLVVMPVNELVKAKPDLEDIFTSSVLPVLPFGTQEGVLRQLLPPAAQKLASLAGQDELWSRTFNTVYRYELIKYNLGERESMPSLEEVSKLTNDFYKVRILSNLVMPFAAQYDSPLSFYSQQFRKLQDVYGRDAEVLFLEMYPEMGPALVSSSFNPTGAQASQKAFGNIKKYGDLVSQIGQTAPEMIGFLVNDPDGKYDFSEAVYAWQYGNAPVPGSTDKFRERRDPAQLKRDANIKVGWIEFRKNMNLLDSQLQAQGYQSYSESGAEELQALKQLMVTDLSQRNPDWQADYLNVDRGKWIYRMQAMRSMLSNPKWMSDNGNRQVVQAMAIYLQARGQVARELQTRKSYGAASTLAAEDNADLDGYWNSVIYQLKSGSPEFEDFFNRFLQNDPVTLG